MSVRAFVSVLAQYLLVVTSQVMCCSALWCVAVRCSVLQSVAVRCSVLQCVAVSCSVLQSTAECRRVFQGVASSHRTFIENVLRTFSKLSSLLNFLLKALQKGRSGISAAQLLAGWCAKRLHTNIHKHVYICGIYMYIHLSHIHTRLHIHTHSHYTNRCSLTPLQGGPLSG